jgi:hypothetical protein
MAQMASSERASWTKATSVALHSGRLFFACACAIVTLGMPWSSHLAVERIGSPTLLLVGCDLASWGGLQHNNQAGNTG